MEIVPIEDTCWWKAQVRTSDIAFIHVGQSATVKFDTYDYSILRWLEGDRGIHQHRMPSKIRARARRNAISVFVCDGQELPGDGEEAAGHRAWLHATAEILTEQRDRLAYLLKPILKPVTPRFQSAKGPWRLSGPI